MITDQQSNFIYLSGLSESSVPAVFEQLKFWFNKLNVSYGILPGTKDLWVVDFMPLQVDEYRFVQFNYYPDYLKPKLYRHTKTKPEDCTAAIGIDTIKSKIVLDGGNVIKHHTKAVLTDKVFKENAGWAKDKLLNELKDQLRVEQLIIIPQEPGDFVGHADGMVRFINENAVLINEYPTNRKYHKFAFNLRSALRNAGLNCILFPYTAWRNQDVNDATGCYINFLEIGNYVFLPGFGAVEDEQARSQLTDVFSGREIITINCSGLSKTGGVLNCATWNIYRPSYTTNLKFANIEIA